jgi:DNA-binding response OmpR family regulator
MKPNVLIVDDESFSLDFLQAFLGTQFDFDYAANGHDALKAVVAGNPALILMDVEMPGGMNGYQACRAIKDSKASQNIPVIFVSSHTEAEDRLRAYESGGDDYVSKPLNVKELKHKIALALAAQEKRNELAEKANQASTVAMMSLREAADSGVVFGFLSDISRQTDLDAIADTTLRTLQKFQIEGAVQLRDGRNHLSRNSAGACTPVEDSVLTEMARDARIVDLGKRSAFNYERATIIVYDMPLQDAELYGRLKDTVVKMAEALDVQLRSLETVASALERGDKLLKLTQRNTALSRDIGTRMQVQRGQHNLSLKALAERMESAAATPGLAEAQQLLLRNLARDVRSQAQAVHDDSAAIETALQSLLAGVDDSLLQESPKAVTSAPDAGTTRFNSVELF